MTMIEAVAERIQGLLKEKNMTQRELEQRAGISHGGMNRILRGETANMALKTCLKIARGFGMKLGAFFDYPPLSPKNFV
ncbi:hypothetical protein FACS1894211_03560 [Clostridia bacterium]|nr:hypothetical protein FACS1894211_03560 [Clostridia bacterium]